MDWTYNKYSLLWIHTFSEPLIFLKRDILYLYSVALHHLILDDMVLDEDGNIAKSEAQQNDQTNEHQAI